MLTTFVSMPVGRGFGAFSARPARTARCDGKHEGFARFALRGRRSTFARSGSAFARENEK